jgi:hypothetical protein
MNQDLVDACLKAREIGYGCHLLERNGIFVDFGRVVRAVMAIVDKLRGDDAFEWVEIYKAFGEGVVGYQFGRSDAHCLLDEGSV